MVVRGNFVWAFEKKLSPTLKVGGATYQPNLVTTQGLGFSVPASHFTSKDAIVPVSLELVTPYEQGHVFKSVVPGVFRLLVGVLPASPVRSLALTQTISSSGTATKTTTAPPGAAESGGGWHLDSFDCRDHSLTQSVRADPGWTIQPSTAAIGYSWNKNPGGANVSLVSGQSQIVVKANTYARCFLGISNGSGSITFYLTYTQEQPWQSGKEETIPLTIRWGDKLVVPVPPGHWQLNAQLFDGRTLQFRSSDTSNQFLTVLDKNDSIQIATPDTGVFALQT
jgi:hypothetical protein